QHEELRAVEDAASKQHLARGRGAMKASTVRVLDTGGSRPLEDHAGRERARPDSEIAPSHGRSKKGHRGATAPAGPDRPLAATEAVLVLAVVVLGERPVGFSGCIQPPLEQRISIARLDD